MELKGRSALVTGAARIGRAIALRLAQDGCDVAVHFHNSANEAGEVVAACRQLGVRAEGFAADLADLDATRRLGEDVLTSFGRLDVLINNASIFPRASIESFDASEWGNERCVNLTAPMLLAATLADELRRRRGRIVNLCDAATSQPTPAYLAYIVSKGGLDTLTRVLSRTLAPDVNVVGVAPGVAAWPDDYAEDAKKRLLAKIPLARAGEPDDIATAVMYLLRDGDYITGEILRIDGGRHLV